MFCPCCCQFREWSEKRNHAEWHSSTERHRPQSWDSAQYPGSKLHRGGATFILIAPAKIWLRLGARWNALDGVSLSDLSRLFGELKQACGLLQLSLVASSPSSVRCVALGAVSPRGDTLYHSGQSEAAAAATLSSNRRQELVWRPFSRQRQRSS